VSVLNRCGFTWISWALRLGTEAADGRNGSASIDPVVLQLSDHPDWFKTWFCLLLKRAKNFKCKRMEWKKTLQRCSHKKICSDILLAYLAPLALERCSLRFPEGKVTWWFFPPLCIFTSSETVLKEHFQLCFFISICSLKRKSVPICNNYHALHS